MKKPGPKFWIVMNLTMNLPMAFAMSLVAGLLNRGIHMPGFLISVLVSFAVSCLISAVLPIPKIMDAFAGLFHLDAKTIPGGLVANLPIALIFNVIMGLTLTWVNAGILGRQPANIVFLSFCRTFLPLYIVCYVVSFFLRPAALKLAMRFAK